MTRHPRRTGWALGALVATAAAVVPAVLAAPAAAASGSGSGGRTIEIEDKCDPVSFSMATPPIPCVGDGNVTLEELLARANLDDGGHRAWRFDRKELTVRPGEHVHVVNVGGEAHTFTRVTQFGRTNVVPPLDNVFPANQVAAPALTPEQAFAQAHPPGAAFDVTDLQPGINLYQCFIHPWMQTTITVRSR